jgi:hypothetical protein
MDDVAGQMNSSALDKRQDRRHPFAATAHLFSLPGWHLPQNRIRQFSEAAGEITASIGAVTPLMLSPEKQ